MAVDNEILDKLSHNHPLYLQSTYNYGSVLISMRLSGLEDSYIQDNHPLYLLVSHIFCYIFTICLLRSCFMLFLSFRFIRMIPNAFEKDLSKVRSFEAFKRSQFESSQNFVIQELDGDLVSFIRSRVSILGQEHCQFWPKPLFCILIS